MKLGELRTSERFPLIVDSNDLNIGFWWRCLFYDARYPHLTVAQHYSLRIDEEVLILLAFNCMLDTIVEYHLIFFKKLPGSIHRFSLFMLEISQGIPGDIAEVHLVFRLDGFFKESKKDLTSSGWRPATSFTLKST